MMRAIGEELYWLVFGLCVWTWRVFLVFLFFFVIGIPFGTGLVFIEIWKLSQ